MARSKESRKLYLQADKANKLKKVSMNSAINIKKENNLGNFYRQSLLNLVKTDYSQISCVNSRMKAYRSVYLLDSVCRFGTASLLYLVSDNFAYHRKLAFYLLSYNYHRNVVHSS